ncbi:hypothetical protein GIB67_016598 [Kingdonia uniflora]|uniref:Peptidase S8/S53 domain-containing protein n=1 Tax=Kingdonia uniflora TaxID=39325 RepID=A0A7J7MZH9_9MAGN|nr:hypothetical protein GIB67_016598 [Kingdonia uniflora]
MLLYTYNHVMHGFSARLTPSQFSKLEKMPCHRATYRESYGKLFTTHTTSFLGLKYSSGLWPTVSYGKYVIIGMIDSGIWPESNSFRDNGMTPVPDRWKGECENGTAFSPSLCNCKLIGARFFSKGLQAGGTARGVTPGARVAMYKVLWAFDNQACAATDVLAGMDQAIADDIEKGIFVVCATGNFGSLNSVHNGAPWIMTIGAGSADRSFVGALTLGNGLALEGTSYFPQSVYITDAPLYYDKGNMSKEQCYKNALVHSEVAGKVVLCDSSYENDIQGQIAEVARARAIAAIFMTDLSNLATDEYIFPLLVLQKKDGDEVKKYATGNNSSIVKEMKFVITKLGTKPSPQVAFFSSRGLDPINPGILKPDILAPGVDVLAAVSPTTIMEGIL